MDKTTQELNFPPKFVKIAYPGSRSGVGIFQQSETEFCMFGGRLSSNSSLWYAADLWKMTVGCRKYYYGGLCDITSCGGVLSNDTNVVCGGMSHGICRAYNECACNLTYWKGDICQYPICSLVNGSLCSGRGNCVSPERCNCTTLNTSGIIANGIVLEKGTTIRTRA